VRFYSVLTRRRYVDYGFVVAAACAATTDMATSDTAK